VSAPRLRIAALAIAAALLVAPSPAPAQGSKPITHKVTRGDTLELLAAEYYGSRKHAIFIMKANGITHSRALRPGESLKIPFVVKITARAGDTLEALAAEHLGDARRTPFLAEFNGIDPGASIAAGETVEIPFHLAHVADNKTTLRQLSLSYFSSARNQELLRKYNFLQSSAVNKGDKILIPITHVRVSESKLPKLDNESQALVERRRELQEQARSALPAASTAWRAGDYAQVKGLLAGIDTEYLDAAVAVAIGVLLGSAYIASEDADSARAAFQKALQRKPEYPLSSYQHSPKVLEAWKAAGGSVRKGR
jgi:LysM repeat protein